MNIQNLAVLREKHKLIKQLYSELEECVLKEKHMALYSLASRAITDELEKIQDAILKEVLDETEEEYD